MLAVGVDERIQFLVTRGEELLDRKGHVAARFGDQTTHEPVLRVEVGRNPPQSVGDEV
jgi:hypothetical protein